MSTEQWIGGLLAVIGGYFVICSIRFRSFFLYRLKIARLKALVGESNAHRFYFLLGALAVVWLVCGLVVLIAPVPPARSLVIELEPEKGELNLSSPDVTAAWGDDEVSKTTPAVDEKPSTLPDKEPLW